MAIVTVLVRSLFLREPPGSDQGLFLAQADLILHGQRLYSEVWEHKPPGVVAVYAAAMSAFGRSYLALKLLHALTSMTSSLLALLVLLRAGVPGPAALFGAIAYVLYYAGPAFGGYWAVAQAETFLDPLLLAAFLCIQPWRTEPTSRARYFGAGVAIGIAIAVMKYSAVPWLGLAVFCSRKSFRVLGPSMFAAGCVAVALSVTGYFAVTGRLHSWFDATVLFNLDHQEIGAVSFWSDPLGYLFPSPLTFLPLYALAAVAVIRELRSEKADALTRWLKVSLVLWALTFGHVLIQRKFWAYHYQVLLLPLCFVASVGMARSIDLLGRRMEGKRPIYVCLAATALLSFGYALRCADYVYRHALVSAALGRISEDELGLRYAWGTHEYSYAADVAVARQVAKSSGPNDRILIWAFEPLIYFLSDRRPAARFLYDYPLAQEVSSLRGPYLKLLMDDLRSHPPALILTRTNDQNNIERLDSMSELAATPELASYLRAHYTASWTIADFVSFVRKP